MQENEIIFKTNVSIKKVFKSGANYFCTITFFCEPLNKIITTSKILKIKDNGKG